jgi:hypothetical protein
VSRFENIVRGMPEGTILPLELKSVCDYLDRHGYPISGCMKIRPDDGALAAWFGGDAPTASQFAGFGAGPDGSIVAFWLFAGPDARSAPIIHLGSEGSGNKVLARDFRNFLALFGIGYDELGYDDLSKPPGDPNSALALRTWLLNEHAIRCPAVGAEIAAAAARECPDLRSCIESWYAK